MTRIWRGAGLPLMVGALMIWAGVFSGCVVRGSAAVQPATVTVVDEGPPPPRYETPASRSGYVWLQGHWSWNGGQWVWQRGRWHQARSGYVYEPARWVQRGSRWHYVEGRWRPGRVHHATPAPRPRPRPAPAPRDPVYHATPDGPPPRTAPPASGSASSKPGRTTTKVITADNHPRRAPPEPRYRRVDPRPGYVWKKGYYRWDNNQGDYVWVNGGWVRQEPGKRWVDGRWERRSDYYVWIPGGWR